jgi:hypothetical protein
MSPDGLERSERGLESLTVELAVKLGELTVTDPELWATLQMQHDLSFVVPERSTHMATLGSKGSATTACALCSGRIINRRVDRLRARSH